MENRKNKNQDNQENNYNNFIDSYKEFIKFKEDFTKYEKKIKDKNNKKIDIDFEEINKILYIKNFFYSYENLYNSCDFFEILTQIIGASIKNSLAECEYYLNLKQGTEIQNIDFEIISKEKNSYYFEFLKMYKLYRNFVKMNITRDNFTDKIFEFLQETYNIQKEYFEFSNKFNDKIINLVDEKIKNFDSNENKNKNINDNSSLFY